MSDRGEKPSPVKKFKLGDFFNYTLVGKNLTNMKDPINQIKYISPRSKGYFHRAKKSRADRQQERLNAKERQEMMNFIKQQKRKESAHFYSKIQQSTGPFIRIIGDPLPCN
mmetsp:Transcript_4168/g.6204  ORF Transcript_4168/g.6204 Transcript_4168/m.6204 type:complete len:111 (+) Transcript_4168:2961-3293(+)|eukprot:CAMPEP_0170511898 /NCGR_PEP_ID=MMETSP0208-20121228/66549_1 /TAXON_ID=197538 /ORGANISM="Strombidium inclinatum, Strain S3" /LENGTH=110 /DNA_ID=CAMNT_0010795473 /DNA_START=3777 /DNA_END=4109 /DNA_ORIENTATION=-